MGVKSRAGMKSKSFTNLHLFILISFSFCTCICIAICHVNINSPQWKLLDISHIALGYGAEFHDTLAPGSGGCAIVCGPRSGLPDMCPGLWGMGLVQVSPAVLP